MKPPIKERSERSHEHCHSKDCNCYSSVFVVVQVREARWYDGKRTSREEAAEEPREHNDLVVFGDRNGNRENTGGSLPVELAMWTQIVKQTK